MIAQSPPGEVLVVVSAAEMSRADFARHFSVRHKESLAGMPFLPESISDPVWDAYLAFHNRLHEITPITLMENGHEHDD